MSGIDMIDDFMPGRVARLETSAARVEVQMHALETGQGAIIAQLGALGDKFDRGRPSVTSIWGPLAAMTAILGLIGGAIATPQLGRISAVEVSRQAEAEVVTRNRIEIAVLCERSGGRCPS